MTDQQQQVHLEATSIYSSGLEVRTSSLVEVQVDMSTSLSPQSLLDQLEDTAVQESHSWAIKICNSCHREESLTNTAQKIQSHGWKRRRRNSNQAGGRRRGRHWQLNHNHNSSLVTDEVKGGGSNVCSPSEILSLLKGNPNLCSLVRLEICDLEDSIPVEGLCKLLNEAPNLKELTLDNVVLYGKPTLTTTADSHHTPAPCCPNLNLERVHLCSCGPAEDSFFQWLISHTNINSSLVDLSLKQMVASTQTLNAIFTLSSLKKLQLDSISGLCQSNLLDNLGKLPLLRELHLKGAVMPAKRFTGTDKQQWDFGNHLQTLVLELEDSPQDTLREMGVFVMSLLQQHQESLQNLSLKFLRANRLLQIRGSWSDFANVLAPALRHNSKLESLAVYFADCNGWDAIHRTDGSLESVLAQDNTVLSKVLLTTTSMPQHTLQFSSSVEFYLGLNKAGRRQWLHKEQMDTSVLAGASKIFPWKEAHQLSMLFYVLSNHPSWVQTLHQ